VASKWFHWTQFCRTRLVVEVKAERVGSWITVSSAASAHSIQSALRQPASRVIELLLTTLPIIAGPHVDWIDPAGGLTIAQAHLRGMNATEHSAPTGWYTDPSNADSLRWWDGMKWTEHTSP